MSDELRAFYQRQIDDPATPDAVRAWLQAQLDALPPAPPAPASPAAATATVGDANAITDATAAIGNTTGGDFAQHNQSGGINAPGATLTGAVAGRDVNQHTYTYYYAAQTELQPLLDAYLDTLLTDCCRLPLADVDDFDPQQSQIALDAVYTMLEVASTVDVSADDQRQRFEKQRQRTALEAVSAHGRLVLLGEPGGGKSTFVNYLTLVLAQAQRRPAALDQLPGWTHGAVLPVRIILRAFAVWVAQHGAGIGAADRIWRYLEQLPKDPLSPGLVTALRQAVRAGTALLLLDGYDEVPGAADGQPLRDVREALVALRQVPLVLVTCRVLDYTESPERQLVGWPDERIIPFSDALQQQFIGQWYATLHSLKRPTQGDPDHLRAEVRGRPELRRLAGNPLLLTMMAQLHAFKTRLPDERVTLYAECIEFLLYRWRPKHQDRALADVLELPTWGQQHTLELLNRLGYTAHRLGTASDGERGADLPMGVLLETAQAYFKAFDPYKARKRALAFAEYVGIHSNGVLQQVGPDTFRFPHRTFQEFLAARRLVSEDDWPVDEDDVVERCVAVLPNPQWREVLSLAISQLVQTNQARTSVDIIEAIREHGEPRAFAEVVAAELWTEVGRERTERLGTKRKQSLTDTVGALVTIIENPDPLLDGQYRIRAGTALGTLGDPRPGVCDLTIDWCDVPAGAYTLGSDDRDPDGEDDEKPLQTVTLAGFRIARYPVTNAQWGRFLAAGGYTDAQWWQWGWEVKEREQWIQPRYWADPQFNGPNQPVVGVAWYEAEAFCGWLGQTLGYAVQLPTEAQWEAAARGPERSIYPWGDEWDAERANTRESELGRITAVGSYPHGASWCGAMDMVGNVWEWTRSDFNTGDRANEIDIMKNSTYVSRRGGAWFNPRLLARGACRDGFNPRFRNGTLGGRLVTPLTK